MSSTTRSGRLAAALLAAAFVLAPGLAAQSVGEADYYRAYYLEHEDGRPEAAFELYLAAWSWGAVNTSHRWRKAAPVGSLSAAGSVAKADSKHSRLLANTRDRAASSRSSFVGKCL